MILGAIDVGSNAMRLMIGNLTVENGKPLLAKVTYFRLPIRLGDDVFVNGSISEGKENKLNEGIIAFKKILAFYNVVAYRAVATSALRDAENSKSIIENIKKDHNLCLEIISGKEEAELINQTFLLLDEKLQDFVLIDVGGGSTEITLYSKDKIQLSKSFQIGTVRSLKQQIDPKELKLMKDWLKKKMLPYAPLKVFGTGGNINKLHKILDISVKDSISIEAIYDLSKEMADLSIEDRMKKYTLKLDRADVIVPAMEIYIMVMNEMLARNIYVPKIGLCDGVLLDLYNRMNA